MVIALIILSIIIIALSVYVLILRKELKSKPDYVGNSSSGELNSTEYCIKEYNTTYTNRMLEPNNIAIDIAKIEHSKKLFKIILNDPEITRVARLNKWEWLVRTKVLCKK